ncbi:MAG: ComEC/Rec2 family competence protein [Patescibacteria group bacterium]
MPPKSTLIIWFCLAFITGIFLGTNFFTLPHNLVYFILILFILSYFTNHQLVFIYIILLGLGSGSNHINQYINQQSNNSIGQITTISEKQILTGIITDIPNQKNNSQKLTVGHIQKDHQTYFGQIIITTSAFPRYHLGQIIEITGQITQPTNQSDDFNYIGYLAVNQIYAQSFYPQLEITGRAQSFSVILYHLRLKLIEQTKQYFPPDIAGLLTGLLLGDKNNLSTTAYDNFRTTGLTHIIVVSGYNLTIFAVIFNKFLRGRLSCWHIFFIVLGSMTLFTILTGAEASIVRALIMTSLLILAPLLSRQSHPTIAILLAATIMITINPFILWYDAGFHLSFLAITGLVYFSAPLTKIMTRIRIPLLIKNPLIETCAAQITTAPYIMFSFHQLTLLAPLTNILVLPFIPAVMAIGFLSLLSTFFLPDSISILATTFTAVLLKYFFLITNIFAKIPFATLDVNIDKHYLILYYLVILIVAKIFHSKYATSHHQS